MNGDRDERGMCSTPIGQTEALYWDRVRAAGAVALPHASFPLKRESTEMAGDSQAMATSVVPLVSTRTWHQTIGKVL